MKDIYGFITVRTESSRLPNKCFLPLGEKSVIESVISRCLHYKINPIVCTTISSTDDPIEELSNKLKVKVFRGSVKNKMKRWLNCSEFYGIDDFHTIDADDPFFDSNLIFKSMEIRRKSDLDFVKPSIYSSSGGGSLGYSIKTSYLSSIIKNTDDLFDSEMINNFIESNKYNSSAQMEEDPELDYQIRLTLDYHEDFWLISSIVRILGPVPERGEIIKLFKENPALHKINIFRNNEWSKRQKELLSSQLNLENNSI